MVEWRSGDGGVARNASGEMSACDGFPTLDGTPVVSHKVDWCLGAHCGDHCGHVFDKKGQGELGSLARHIGVAGTSDVVDDDMKCGG
jgi:hypothetical protein